MQKIKLEHENNNTTRKKISDLTANNTNLVQRGGMTQEKWTILYFLTVLLVLS